MIERPPETREAAPSWRYVRRRLVLGASPLARRRGGSQSLRLAREGLEVEGESGVAASVLQRPRLVEGERPGDVERRARRHIRPDRERGRTGEREPRAETTDREAGDPVVALRGVEDDGADAGVA